MRRSRRRRWLGAAAGLGQFADHGAGLGVRPSSNSSSGAPTFTRSPGWASSLATCPALRRGDFHHRLFGLDRDQRLIDDDVVALGDVPGDDLRLLQAFAEIGKVERAHV